MYLLLNLFFGCGLGPTAPVTPAPITHEETRTDVEAWLAAEYAKEVIRLKASTNNPDGLIDNGDSRELQLAVSEVATDTCADASIEFSFDARSNQAAWRCGTHSGGFTIGKELHLKVELDADKNDVYPYRVCGEGLATILVSPNREEVTIRCPKQSDYRVPDGPFNNYVIPSPF